MASLNDINALLRNIEDNTSLLVEDEKRIINAIAVIQQKPDTTKKPIHKPYELQQTYGSEMQQLLSKIEQMVNYLIQRNQTWRTYHENLLDGPKISIKQYITDCNIKIIKNCYDNIDRRLQTILPLKQEKQEGQDTIFQKGYLLYDLVRDNDINQFRYLLTSNGITYNDVRHKPQPQVGGKLLKLLQVIGLTKIKAILEYMYEKYKEATEYNFSITKGATTINLKKYLSYNSYESEGVNIFYERNDEQESVQQTEELTAEHCKQIYKNGNIINIIASFFYEEAILHKKQ
jgi:hypothetical protein